MDLFNQNLILPIAILLTAIAGYLFNKVDLKGSITGLVIALFIWTGTGLEGIISLFLFFIIGSLATSWEKDKKSKQKLEQENGGKRNIFNVLGNLGVAGILSVFAIALPVFKPVLIIMVIASFATACSDTLSSELGNVYGKKYYNIITLKPSERGPDGVISKEGLWFGLIGSFVIVSFMFFFDYSIYLVLTVAFSGLLGNIIDSVLGATLQQKGYLNNHQVNFAATLCGSLLCFCMLIISKI